MNDYFDDGVLDRNDFERQRAFELFSSDAGLVLRL